MRTRNPMTVGKLLFRILLLGLFLVGIYAVPAFLYYQFMVERNVRAARKSLFEERDIPRTSDLLAYVYTLDNITTIGQKNRYLRRFYAEIESDAMKELSDRSRFPTHLTYSGIRGNLEVLQEADRKLHDPSVPQGHVRAINRALESSCEPLFEQSSPEQWSAFMGYAYELKTAQLLLDPLSVTEMSCLDRMTAELLGSDPQRVEKALATLQYLKPLPEGTIATIAACYLRGTPRLSAAAERTLVGALPSARADYPTAYHLLFHGRGDVQALAAVKLEELGEQAQPALEAVRDLLNRSASERQQLIPAMASLRVDIARMSSTRTTVVVSRGGPGYQVVDEKASNQKTAAAQVEQNRKLAEMSGRLAQMEHRAAQLDRLCPPLRRTLDQFAK